MITKEQIFEKLKEKREKNSPLSEQSINEALEPLMTLVTEETELEDFLKKVEPIFKTMEGNLRKLNSETAKEMEKKYEGYVKPTDEPKEKEKPKEKKEDEIPEWAKKIMARQEEEDKAKEAGKVKQEALKKVEIYPKSVVDIVSENFDFSKEGASEKFVEKVGEAAGKLGITPETTKPEDGKSRFSELRKKIDNEKNF